MRVKRTSNSRRSVTMSILGIVTASALVLTVSACGSGSNNSTSSGSYADQTCFTQMDPSQKAQIVDFVNQQGGQVQSTTNNPDDTQDVCVLEPDGSGGYNERYYGRNDGFADYLLYSAMFGRSSYFTTALLVSSGDLTPQDAIILGLLTGVNSSGGLYQPYSRSNTGDWNRTNTVIKNKTVNHIYYGATDAGSFATAHTQPPPRGYTVNTVPSATVSRATVPTPLKSNASVSAIPNPATNSSAAASATSAAASTTAAAPTTSQPSSQTTSPKPSTTQQAPSTTSRRTTTAPAPTSRRTSVAPAPSQRSVPPKPKPTRR